MANVTASLPVPSQNGTGAAILVDSLGPDKTVIITGTIEAVVAIQISEDGVSFSTVLTFTGPGQKLLPQTVAQFMRTEVSGYKRGAAGCAVGAELVVNDFVTLTVPAGNGTGVAVDVSAFGSLWTLVVAELGSFLGAISIEVSQDGASWGQVFGTFTGGGNESQVVSAAWARVRRTGFNIYNQGPMSVAIGAFRAVAGGTATNFIQSGAGAVVRTSENKDRERVSIDDYGNDRTDAYAAIIFALSYLKSVGGGVLVFPHGQNVEIDPPTPIEIDFDNLEFHIQCDQVINVSTTGVDFFRFTGGGGRQRINFVGPGELHSVKTAGWMFDFDDDTGLGQSIWTAKMHQLAINAGVIRRVPGPGATSGLFTNIFGGPQWDHGNGSVPGGPDAPTVPMVHMEADLNQFNANWFIMSRTNSHHGSARTFYLANLSIGGPYWTRNLISVGTVEQCTFGFVYAAGHLGLTIRSCGIYDLDGLFNHLIEFDTGAGGDRVCDQCVIDDLSVVSIIGDVGGVVGTDVPITSLTQFGGLATLSTAPDPHNIDDGQRIFISGVDQADYNGRFTATKIDANTLTFPVADTAVSPATGAAMQVEQAAMTVKVGPGDSRHSFRSIGGNLTSEAEVDCNNRSVMIEPSHTRCHYYRVDPTDSIELRIGSDTPGVYTPVLYSDYFQPRSRPQVEWAPTNYVYGCRLFWSSNTVVQVRNPGAVRSSDDTWLMRVTSFLGVDNTVTGPGGLDVGPVAADTWYAIYVIGTDTDPDDVDVIGSTNTTTPDLSATTYNKYRRVGWARTNGASQWRKFLQRGSSGLRQYFWDDDLANLNVLTGGSALVFTDVIMSSLVPPGQLYVRLLVGFLAPTVGGAATDAVFLRDASSIGADGPMQLTAGNTLAASRRQPVEMPCTSGRKIQYMVSDADDDVDIWVLGFNDEIN